MYSVVSSLVRLVKIVEMGKVYTSVIVANCPAYTTSVDISAGAISYAKSVNMLSVRVSIR